MHSVLLTDWITIRGTDTTPVVQSAEDWLDVPDYADAVFWVEVTQVTNPDVKSVTLASAVPLARFARWKLVPNAAGSAGVSDITFRLAAAANMVSGK